MEKRIEELINRGVEALERLAEDPVIHMEVGPPVCPHCETHNPRVATREEETSGPLHEFVVICVCLECEKRFYAIPINWHCVKSEREAEAELRERAELVGAEGRN